MVDRQYVSGLVKQHRVSLFIIVDAVLQSVLKCNNSVFQIDKIYGEKKNQKKKKKILTRLGNSVCSKILWLSGQDVVHHRWRRDLTKRA